MANIQDKDLLQFFQDIEFMPPNDRDNREFINGQMGSDDDDVSDEAIEDMSGDAMWDDMQDQPHDDHPDPDTYADYYMFTDPAASRGVMKSPKSELANKLDFSYQKKDLSDIHSVSDSHYETLEQEAPLFPKHINQPAPEMPYTGDGSFPKHDGIRSMMEPSVFMHEETLKKETMIEGELYPKGTVVKWPEEKQ